MSKTTRNACEQNDAQSTCRPSSASNVAEENEQLVRSVAFAESQLPAPTDLSVSRAKPIVLERLQWENYDTTPESVTLTNTGDTVVLGGRWYAGCRPSLRGGPLGDRRYRFSQLHFHWGRSALEGSEHTVDGYRLPLEVHAMHFDERLGDRKAAERVPGGLLCVVYLFRLQTATSRFMEPIVAGLKRVLVPDSHVDLMPFPLDTLLHTFSDEYFLYWGSARSPGPPPQNVPMLWMVSRAQERLSFRQLKQYCALLDRRMRPMQPTPSSVVFPAPRRHLFLVNARTPTFMGTLLLEPPGKYSQTGCSPEGLEQECTCPEGLEQHERTRNNPFNNPLSVDN